MGQKAREKKNRKTTRRAKFRRETIGYIEGLRLAAWVTEKTPGMMDIYRNKNNIAEPVLDTKPPWAKNADETFRRIVDPREPCSGYLGARVVMRALALELALKQIATLAHGENKGALCTHDLSELWLDIPPKTREELQTRLQEEVNVVNIPKDDSRAATTKRPPSIEEVCEQNRNVFVHIRYICEENQEAEGEVITDTDIRGVLRFLSYWIMEKIGYRMPCQPADDATLEARYVPSQNPVQ